MSLINRQKAYKKGRDGENLALAFLIEKGYTLLEKNYKKKQGEIDLIVTSPDRSIIFVEVKYYHPNTLIEAEYAITKKKKQRLLATAKYYIYQNNITDSMFRFDLIVVNEHNSYTHYENIIT